MENTIRTWVKNNNILTFKVKKGGENIYGSTFENSENCADALVQYYNTMPEGNFKVLGSESKSCTESNSTPFSITKTGNTSMQNINHSANQQLFTLEQLNDKIGLARKEWQFENLEKRVSELELDVRGLKKDNDILKKAVVQLTDENEENNSAGMQKIAEFAQGAKSLMQDFTL